MKYRICAVLSAWVIALALCVGNHASHTQAVEPIVGGCLHILTGFALKTFSKPTFRRYYPCNVLPCAFICNSLAYFNRIIISSIIFLRG